jgi:hypothetical protein
VYGIRDRLIIPHIHGEENLAHISKKMHGEEKLVHISKKLIKDCTSNHLDAFWAREKYFMDLSYKEGFSNSTKGTS